MQNKKEIMHALTVLASEIKESVKYKDSVQDSIEDIKIYIKTTDIQYMSYVFECLNECGLGDFDDEYICSLCYLVGSEKFVDALNFDYLRNGLVEKNPNRKNSKDRVEDRLIQVFRTGAEPFWSNAPREVLLNYINGKSPSKGFGDGVKNDIG